MGANAQTSVPAFTSGQVLTAAQVTQINTGIPVFASSTERDAAFGGTGEKTLAEGQMAYLEDTNATQYYDGSSWAAVGGSAAVVQVVTATYSTAETTTSGTLVDTSLAASITPTSASNKVLVVITSPLNVNNTGSTTESGEGRVGIKRDSTDVYAINYQLHYFDSADSTDRGLSVNGTITYVDSPATTSATTYTFRFAASGCTMTAQFQNQVSTIVLMEVTP